jgi:hypothetical protein
MNGRQGQVRGNEKKQKERNKGGKNERHIGRRK